MKIVSEFKPQSNLRQSTLRFALLAAIILTLAAFKLWFNPYPCGDFGRDGCYYYQVARHVAEGHGLQTSISDQGQGLKQLPHTTPVYPLWPLTLGWLGAAIGMERAASAVPEALYLVALVLLYALVNSVASTWGNAATLIFRRVPVLDVGHVSVVLMGLNHVFFKFTSLPYTEGLAFCLLFAVGLATIRGLQSGEIGWFWCAGILSGLGFLTRSQLIGAIFLVPVSALVVGLRDRKYARAIHQAAAAFIPGLLLTLVWTLYLASTFDHFTPFMLLDFNAAHETPELAAKDWMVTGGSLWGLAWDRAVGILVAFKPDGRYSYFQSFGYSIYLIPLALFHLLMRPQRFWRSLHSFDSPGWRSIIGMFAVAMGPIAAVHMMHKTAGWNFQFRHGLPIVLIIVTAFCYLIAQPGRTFRVLALVAMAAGFGNEIGNLQKVVRQTYTGPTSTEIELAHWMDEEKIPPTLVSTHPWDLSDVTRGRFHVAACNAPATQMPAYSKYANVTHVLRFDFDKNCSFFEKLEDYADPVIEFGDEGSRMEVWRFRETRSASEARGALNGSEVQ